jgi:hypothetical protein
MCKRLENFPKRYESFSTDMSRTVEDNWNVKNMKAFRDFPGINCVKEIYSKVAETSLLTFQFSNVEHSNLYTFRTFCIWLRSVKRTFVLRNVISPNHNFETIPSRVSCVQQHALVITLYERHDFILTQFLSTKWSVSSVCLLNPLAFYETQEYSVPEISYIKIVNLSMKNKNFVISYWISVYWEYCLYKFCLVNWLYWDRYCVGNIW